MSGGKNARTVIAVVDYYPEPNKLILSQLVESIKSEEEVSADDILLESLKALKPEIIAVDVPLSLPRCVTCQLKCPGVSSCKQSHIKWFWKYFRENREKKKTLKLFTPYTQRPVEAWMSQLEEEAFHPSDALGANVAPLSARMQFLLRRMPGVKVIEVFPKLSLWRIGLQHSIMKRYLRFHKHSVDGDKARLHILNKLVDQGALFLYHQDMAKLIQNGHGFDSLICALTAQLEFLGKTEARPKDFPQEDSWIAIPTL